MIGETTEEKGDNQTKQQDLLSMLIRRFHNHCLIQLVRHQVKNSFKNLKVSLYFPAIGHIVAADTVTAYQNYQQQKQRLDTLYTHHALNSCLSLHLSKLLPFLLGFTVITNTTTNCISHDSRKSGGRGQWSHQVFVRTLYWGWGGSK